MSETIKPTSYDELFPGRFLKAGLFKGRDVTLTIADVVIDELEGEKGVEKKAIVGFNETPLAIVLNRSNGEALKRMFGKDVRSWVGKRVTFYPTQTKLGKETVDAIRVRGSPDLDRDVSFELRLPKRKPQQVTLTKTQQQTKPAEPAKET